MVSEGKEELAVSEVWQVVLRHRGLSLAVFVSTLIASLVYLMLSRPVFVAEGAFFIGAFEYDWLDVPVVLQERMESAYGSAARPGAAAWLERVSVDRADPRVIRYKVQGTSAEEVGVLAAKVMADVLVSHDQKLKSITDGIESELRDLRELSGARGSYEKVKGGSAGVEGGSTRARMEELGAVRMRIGDLERMLRSKVTASGVVVSPSPTGTLVAPHKSRVVGFGLFLGVLLSLVTAFGADLAIRHRRA